MLEWGGVSGAIFLGLLFFGGDGVWLILLGSGLIGGFLWAWWRQGGITAGSGIEGIAVWEGLKRRRQEVLPSEHQHRPEGNQAPLSLPGETTPTDTAWSIAGVPDGTKPSIKK